MSVKFGVLGLLAENECHPYQVSMLFKNRIGPAWDINRGQIYQMVHRLEQEGLVERVPGKGDGPQWLFRTTDEGKQKFDDWYTGSSQRIRPLRDDLFVKVALCTPEHADYLLDSIAHQERACIERLREYSDLQAQFGSLSSASHWEQIMPNILLEAAVAHLHTEIKWLRDVRVKVRELIAANGGEHQLTHPELLSSSAAHSHTPPTSSAAPPRSRVPAATSS